MGDTQTTAGEAQEAQQTAQQTAAEAQSTEAGATPEKPAEGSEEGAPKEGEQESQNSLDELPEWARKEVESLRREAASKRIKNNELTQQLEAIRNEGDPAEQKRLVEELQSNLQRSELELNKVKFARQYGLPEGSEVLLSATDPQLLEAQAKMLAALTAGKAAPVVPQPSPVPPAGGREPYAEPEPTADDLLAKARSRR
jgi:hypothetical protein